MIFDDNLKNFIAFNSFMVIVIGFIGVAQLAFILIERFNKLKEKFDEIEKHINFLYPK